MRTLAIGDIHGCDAALKTLLEQVEPRSDDRMIFLGDYIDRGPASREVVESLLDLSRKCSPVFNAPARPIWVGAWSAGPLRKEGVCPGPARCSRNCTSWSGDGWGFWECKLSRGVIED